MGLGARDGGNAPLVGLAAAIKGSRAARRQAAITGARFMRVSEARMREEQSQARGVKFSQLFKQM